MKPFICPAGIVLMMALWAMAGPAGGTTELPHRPPAVAGMWYAAEPGQLRIQVEGYLARAADKSRRPAGETPVALIVPHAGYMFSGQTAARAYVHLRGASFRRAVLIGPAHRAMFSGVSIPAVAAYDTPLGSVPLDRAACDLLLKQSLIGSHPDAHDEEHNLEAQLPFLQVLLPDIRIIPMLTGNLAPRQMDQLADLIAPLLDDSTILIISSDFTHYGPSFRYVPFRENVASQLEKYARTAGRHITDLDFDGFMDHCRTTGDTICGQQGIGVAIKVLRKLAQNKKINGTIEGFATSAELTKDWTNSVSYLAVLFTDPPLSPAAQTNSPPEPPPSFALSDEEKDTLLRLARHTLTAYLATGKMPEFDSATFRLTPTLYERCGAFVTLTKRHHLRGCIGYVMAVKPLYVAVQDMVINAAVRDPRFPPVTAAELDEISLEISVLSPLEPCPDPDRVTVGRHGLVIQKDGRSGLLLPQVPVQWGWDRTEFLRQVCAKAGLPPDAYRSPNAVLYVFTAEVFHEPE